MNYLAENLIKYKFDRIDLGSEHKTAVESSEDLRVIMDEFKRLSEHPELEITESIGEIRNKIDLHREQAKKKIDDDAIELIRELDEYEARCKSGLSGEKLAVSSEVQELINSLESDRSKWEKELNMFERSVKKLKTIHLDSIDGCDKLRNECKIIKKSIFNDEFEILEKKQKLFCGEKIDPRM